MRPLLAEENRADRCCEARIALLWLAGKLAFRSRASESVNYRGHSTCRHKCMPQIGAKVPGQLHGLVGQAGIRLQITNRSADLFLGRLAS